MTELDPVSGIEVKNLSKRFNREWIFRNLNYSFHRGNTYAIVGPNGSGKSTLLQVLWGQVPPSAGQIFYNTNSADIHADEIYSRLSIATPYMDLIEEFSLIEQIRFHFSLKSMRGNLSIDDLVDILYLQPSRDKYISNFSSGMKQRLKLGLALYTRSDLIFLDEPGSHLDQTAFAWYRDQLNKLPNDVLILIGSNDPSEYPENAIKLNLSDFKG